MTPETEKKTLLGSGYQSIDNEETGTKTGATNDGHSNDDVGDDKSKTLKEELDEKRLYSFFDASNCPGSRATKGFGLLLVPFFIAGGLFITRTSISEAPAVSISTLSFGPGVMEVTSSNGIMHTRSRLCTSNNDCSPEKPYCNNNNKLGSDYPPPNWCFECIVDGHCGENRECQHTGSALWCDNFDVPMMPSIGKAENLYNLFTGDPLFVLNKIDPGFTTNKFYQQTFSGSDQYKHEVQNKERYEPIEIGARPLGGCTLASETTVVTKTSSYTTAIGKAVTIGAEATVKGVNLGGNVGTSSYNEVNTNVISGQTTVTLNQECYLYTFDLRGDAKLNLLPRTKKTLELLRSDDYTGWKKFFNDYGTHIISGGTMGSFARRGVVFTTEERSEVETATSSFEAGVTIGMPEVFGLSAQKNAETMSEAGKTISKQNRGETSYTQGSLEEPLLDPGFVMRKLIPVCEKIDVGTYTNIDKDSCYAHMKSYCIEMLAKADLTNTDCAYPMDKHFECIIDSDCGSQYCKAGKCVECLEDSDCDSYFMCSGDNKCNYNVNLEFRNIGTGGCLSNLGEGSSKAEVFSMPGDKRTPMDCAERCRGYNDLFGFDIGYGRCRCFLNIQGRRNPFPVRLNTNGGYTCYARKDKNCADYDCNEHYWSSCSPNPSCPAGYEYDYNKDGPCWWPTERIVCKRTFVCTRC